MIRTGYSRWPAMFATGQGANAMSGETYGFELAASYEINPCWSVRGAYSLLRMQLRGDPSVQRLASSGENPQNQASLTFSGDLNYNLELDLTGRYIDSLPAAAVPHYIVLDARLGWRPRQHLEVFIVGRNLLDQEHAEFGADTLTGSVITEVQAEVYGGMTWRY